MSGIHGSINIILEELRQTLAGVDETQTEALVEAISGGGKVFVTGVGRVLLSMQAFVKRLNHLGIRASYVGQLDEPAAEPGNLLIVASNSGESLFPAAIAGKGKKLGMRIAYIGGNPQSTVGRLADLQVILPVNSKLDRGDRIVSRQPMTSLFEQALYLLCDAVCMEIVARKHIDLASLWEYHANLE